MNTITYSRYLVNKFLTDKLMKCAQDVPAKHILDVGCGKKPYIKYFPITNDYIGIDKRSALADVKGVSEYLPFKSKIFDTALCTQVLEHVESPRKLLKELNRALASGGILILSTHGFWIEGHERTDYWRWTLQGLEKIIKESGFDIIEFYSMEPYVSLCQFVSLYIPINIVGKLFQVLINLCGIFLRGLGNRGPKLNIVHIIKAKKIY